MHFGSQKANNILKLVSRINQDLLELETETENSYIDCGYAQDVSFTKKQGLGPMGIQVMVVRYRAESNGGDNEKTNAYILLDGNNMVHGLREKVISAVSALVDDAEVLTTDNHVVNTTMGGYNPVGLKLEQSSIINSIQRLVRSALRDCEPCQVGVNSMLVNNVNILGQKTPQRLSATINATISVMQSSLVACQALALAACWTLALVL